MATPVWVTDADLGTVYEDDNLLIDLDTQVSSDTFDLILEGTTSLTDPVLSLGTKGISYNSNVFRLGGLTTSTITAKNQLETVSSDSGVQPGTSINIRTAKGTDAVLFNITIWADHITSYAGIGGSLKLDTKTISLAGLTDLNDLVSKINAVTNNSSDTIEAFNDNGVLKLVKTDNIFNNSLIIDVSSVTGGSIGLTTQTHLMSFNQLARNILEQTDVNATCVRPRVRQCGIVNTNWTFSIIGIATSVAIEDPSGNFTAALDIPLASSVPRADVITELGLAAQEREGFCDTANPTVTRASIATYTDELGIVKSVPANFMRPKYSYCPVNKEWYRDGWLAEGESTNLVTRSEEFDHGDWTKSAASITANAIAAPDSNTTADKLVEDNTTANHRVNTSSITIVNGVSYTLSVFAKAAERTHFTFYGSGGLSGATTRVDLSDGSIEIGDPTVEKYNNGWYRISITTVSSSTTGIIWCELYNGAGSYAGDNSSGLYIWGAQLEQTPEATTYIPTVATSVTREIDTVSTNTLPTGWSIARTGDSFTNSEYGILIANGTNVENVGSTGFRLEPQRENLFTRSEEFDHGDWTLTAAATITADYIIAPDGNKTAELLADDNGGGNGSVAVYRNVTVSTTTSYVASIFVKAKQLSWINIGVDGFTTPADSNAYFDIGNGIKGTIDAGYDDSGIEYYGNDWYRCWVSFTTDAADTNGNIRFYAADDDGDSAVARDSTSDIYVWGAQFEQGAQPTSYIPTVAATATRNADTLTIADSVLADGNYDFYIKYFDDTTETISKTASSGVTITSADLSSTLPITNILISNNTELSASLIGSNQLELVAPSFNFAAEDNYSSDVFDILGIDEAGSPFIDPLYEWLSIDNTLGVLQGVTPTTDFTVTVTIKIRATSIDPLTADRTFTLTLQPIELDAQIDWTPANLGTVEEGSSSTLSIDIDNFEVINDSAAFFVLKETTFAFTNQMLDPFTLTRDSVGTYTSANGYIKTAEKDVARFDYDQNVTSRGVLIETESTNLLPYSIAFTQSTWTKSNATVSSNIALGPDNSLSAKRLTEDTATSAHYTEYSATGSVSTNYFLSVFMKADTRDWGYVYVGGGGSGGSDGYAFFDLSTGAVGTTSNVDSASIVEYANGWYRCIIEFTTDSSDNLFTTRLGIANADNTLSYLGNESSIYIWGAQLEQDQVSSYIETTGTIKTRAADIVKLELFNLAYDITVTGPGGSTLTPTTITTKEYILTPRTGESHVLSVTIDRYHQEKVIDETDNLFIDNDGNIGGNFPFISAPPDPETFTFEVILTIQNNILLGPANFSFDVTDDFTNEKTDGFVPTLFVEDDRLTWVNHITELLSNDTPYRPNDVNFGIRSNPEIKLIYGLQDDTAANMFAATSVISVFNVIIGTLKSASTDNYDVLYYNIYDYGSTIDGYTNPLGVDPTTIQPYSLSILRDRLTSAIGFEVAEDLPEWMSTWEPIIPVAYVPAGTGFTYVTRFDNSTALQNFVGKLVKIDRITFQHRNGSNFTILIV